MSVLRNFGARGLGKRACRNLRMFAREEERESRAATCLNLKPAFPFFYEENRERKNKRDGGSLRRSSEDERQTKDRRRGPLFLWNSIA